jgi:hypothetical protein
MDRLKVYPSFRPDQAPEYLAAFKRMITEFDEKRVQEGLTLAIDAMPDFPPTPGRIRQYVPRTAGQIVTCPKCADNEGWVWVTGGDRAGNPAVRRCDHR